MSIPTSQIRTLEIDLIARGYTHRLWRRGIMGTRVFAKDHERVVLVRNIDPSRQAAEDETPTIESWFAQLEIVLADLLKGAKLTDLILVGMEATQVPEPFRNWCQSAAIRLHLEPGSFAEATQRQ